MNVLRDLTLLCDQINNEIKSLTISENYFHFDSQEPRGFEAYRNVIGRQLVDQTEAVKQRLHEEYFGCGPLTSLLENPEVSEIIVNDYSHIWVEKEGKLRASGDSFLSEYTFDLFLQRLYLEIGQEPSLPHPFVDSYWRGHRLHIIGHYSSLHSAVRLTVRKHRKDPWSLAALKDVGWAKDEEIQFLKAMMAENRNFLVIGPTGSGKTSVLKSLLQLCPPGERVIIMEDSKEITVPNQASTHMLTRHDSRNIMPSISLSDLVRQSLRMRPDRLIVGEVRGSEAKDLLLALATGHHGSASTLHASTANQALIRLEMLIQMGAPHWNLQAIRRLILMSIDLLIVCHKTSSGKRYLEGIYRLVSAEESGLIIERCDA